MLILVGLLSIVVLTVATGYFVAQEFAYVAVDRGRLRALAADGDAAARRALRVTERLSFVLSGAQLGITVTALLAGYVAEPYLGQGLAGLLGLAGLPQAASLSLSVVVALLFATAVQMVLGELAPKNLAIAKPEALARALSRSTLVYLAAAAPMIRLFDSVSNRLLRRVGIEPVEELPQGATVEDLDRIIASSRRQGLLDEDTFRLLDHGLDFRTLTTAQAMVHRVDVVTVGASDPAARVVALLETGHTRFPVIDDGVDDVIGVVAIGDVVDVEPADRDDVTAGSLATPAVLVPPTQPLPGVLERLRAEHQQLACVIDEFGGFAGVVSLEDIAEELVGEIRDEDDLPEPAAVAQSDGSWLLPGGWRPDEVTDATDVTLPDAGRHDTLTGLFMARLGQVPRVGDQVDVDLPPTWDRWGEAGGRRLARLRVTAVRHNAVVTVHLTVIDTEAPR